MANIPQGRIPIVEAWVGDPDSIFGYDNGAFSWNDTYKDILPWCKTEGIDVLSFGSYNNNACTLMPRGIPENTRMHPGNVANASKPHFSYITKQATIFKTKHYPSDTTGGDTLPAGTLYPELTNWLYTDTPVDGDQTSCYRGSLTHWLVSREGANTQWISLPESGDKYGKVKLGSGNGVWSEAVHDGEPNNTHVVQTKPCVSADVYTNTEDRSLGNWIIDTVHPVEHHTKNPSIVLSMRTKPTSRAQTASQLLDMTTYDANRTAPGATTKIKLATPTLVVAFAAQTGDTISFCFPKGSAPIAIYDKLKLKLQGDPGLICNYDPNKDVKLFIQYAPPGYYIVYGEMLSQPWCVQFVDKLGAPVYIDIPEGTLDFTFMGFGKFSFSYAPMRYIKEGYLWTMQIDRGFADETLSMDFEVKEDAAFSSGWGAEGRYPTNKTVGKTGVPVNLDIVTSMLVNDATHYPEADMPIPTWDPKCKNKPYPIKIHRLADYGSYGVVLDNNHFVIGITLITNDSTYTPYLYRHHVRYYPFIVNVPSSSMYCVGSAIGNTFGEYATSHIRSFNLTVGGESFWRLGINGSIVFSNNNGEWNKQLNGSNFNPIQSAIKLYFKWVDSNTLANELDLYKRLHPEKDNMTGASFDPTDSNDDKYLLFTGWLVSSTISSQTINKSEVTFQLKDRWYQMEERKLLNAPWFDGTNAIESMRWLLNFGGIKDLDIDTDDLNTKKDPEDYLNYTIANAPASYQNPQFKPSSGSTCAAAFDQIHDTMKLFVGVGNDGRVYFTQRKTVFEAASTTFYDRLIDAPEDSEILWQSLGPFEWSRNAADVFNSIYVTGYQSNPNGEGYPIPYHLRDENSISNPTVENFIGYPKDFLYSHARLCTDDEVIRMAIKLYYMLRYPAETVTWSTILNPLINIYTPVYFKDSKGIIPAEDKTDKAIGRFWITAKNHSFTSATLDARTSWTATVLRGLYDELQDFARS